MEKDIQKNTAIQDILNFILDCGFSCGNLSNKLKIPRRTISRYKNGLIRQANYKNFIKILCFYCYLQEIKKDNGVFADHAKILTDFANNHFIN